MNPWRAELALGSLAAAGACLHQGDPGRGWLRNWGKGKVRAPPLHPFCTVCKLAYNYTHVLGPGYTMQCKDTYTQTHMNEMVFPGHPKAAAPFLCHAFLLKSIKQYPICKETSWKAGDTELEFNSKLNIAAACANPLEVKVLLKRWFPQLKLYKVEVQLASRYKRQ